MEKPEEKSSENFFNGKTPDYKFKVGSWCVLFKDKTNGKQHKQVVTVLTEMTPTDIGKFGYEIASATRLKQLKRSHYK